MTKIPFDKIRVGMVFKVHSSRYHVTNYVRVLRKKSGPYAHLYGIFVDPRNFYRPRLVTDRVFVIYEHDYNEDKCDLVYSPRKTLAKRSQKKPTAKKKSTRAKVGPYVEGDCVFEHEGRKFESGGSVVTDNYLIAYPGKGGVLKTWHGTPIGTWRIVSSWRVNSAYGSHMHQIEATVDGITYTGRGFGEGMIFKGKRKSRRR